MITKRFLRMLAMVPIFLAVPFTAMFFTNEVAWTTFDFIVAAGLLFVLVAGLEIVLKFSPTTARKWIGGIMLLVFFLLIWAELAVGIFGSPFAGS